MNPRFNERDYEFLPCSEEEQKAKLDALAKELQEARTEHFNAKHAMMKEGERLKSLMARGVRHKNKMHKFYERVERAAAHLEQLEESPLTNVLQGIQNESATA